MSETGKMKMLLEKYFEGDTSLWEEQELRDYFSSKTVDKELVAYAPLFQYFKTERAPKRNVSNRFYNRNIMLRSLIGSGCLRCVAARIFLFVQPNFADCGS